MVFSPDSFVGRFLLRAYDLNSVLCVGLDPTYKHIPQGYAKDLDGLERYLRAVIEIACKRVPVVKLQYACYAALGPGGVSVMQRLIEYAHKLGLLVIVDAKRADIGDTMVHYGNEVFGYYGADACTFVPYLGPTFFENKSTQSWQPWFERGKLAISMIRTSNAEASVLQDLMLENGLMVYEQMAKLVCEWNQKVLALDSLLETGGVGGVVGATWPVEALRCRELAGDKVFFLIPGYGAQGGGAAGAVGGLPTSDGMLLGTVNSSRGITLDAWFDRKLDQPREGNPLMLITAAIDVANADLNEALNKQLGGDPYGFFDFDMDCGQIIGQKVEDEAK